MRGICGSFGGDVLEGVNYLKLGFEVGVVGVGVKDLKVGGRLLK